MAKSKNQTFVSDNANWIGSELSSGEGWRYVLSTEEINDLTRMAESIRPSLRGDPNQLMTLQKDQFNVGCFAETLDTIYTNLKDGLGIALIRGLPIKELEPIEVAIIYWAIGLQLGQATPNNPDGDMFGHITDLGKTQKDPNSRGYQTSEAMDYHCDQSDIVGLMCIRAAKSGGISKVASSIAMYNTLLKKYPQHIDQLSEPFYWSKLGEYARGDKPYYQSPVFNHMDNKLCVSFGPTHIEKGHALPDAPALTEQQRAAIRKAEQIASEQRFDMELIPGDIQLLNNYVTLHTRSAYVDHEEIGKKRLLWRLWLMNSDLRPRTAYTKNFQNGVQLRNSKNQIRL